MDSIEPIIIPELNAFERKLVHRQFDNNPNIVTKTYRIGDEDYELRVYPVGNLKRYAQKKADEAVETREKIVLPHMSNYERFVIHDYLKEIDTVNTSSEGEEDDQHQAHHHGIDGGRLGNRLSHQHGPHEIGGVLYVPCHPAYGAFRGHAVAHPGSDAA